MGLTQFSRLVGKLKEGDITEVVQRGGGHGQEVDENNL